MINIKRFRYIFVIILTITSTLLTSPIALAATSSPQQIPNNIGEALEIAPPLIYLNANPGQTITTQIQVRDIAKGDLLVTGQANDFVAAGTNGNPKILFNSSSSTDPYSLKNWVSPLASVILKPQQTNNIKVILNVPKNASPGGHYGVIRFSAVPPSVNGKNGVSLSASLGTLILMTVSGHLVQRLALSKFSAENSKGHAGYLFQSDPLIFSEALKNSGNIALQPAGQVTIKDMFGKNVVSMSINPIVSNILPSSTRIFTENLTPNIIGKKQLFGRYSAILNLTYGTNHQPITAKLTFWVIPIVPIVILLLILIIGFFLLRKLIRRYNQHILDKAKKSK